MCVLYDMFTADEPRNCQYPAAAEPEFAFDENAAFRFDVGDVSSPLTVTIITIYCILIDPDDTAAYRFVPVVIICTSRRR